MANVWYPKGLQKIGNGAVDYLTDDIKVVLYDAGYTADVNADDFLDDIPSGARIVSSPNLSGKTVSIIAGRVVLDAANPTITSVPASEVIVGAAAYKDTGVVATSPLLWKFDQSGGFPLTTDGTNITLSFSGDGVVQL